MITRALASVAQLVGVSIHTLSCPEFKSWSGQHMPRLLVQSRSGHVREAIDWCLSLTSVSMSSGEDLKTKTKTNYDYKRPRLRLGSLTPNWLLQRVLLCISKGLVGGGGMRVSVQPKYKEFLSQLGNSLTFTEVKDFNHLLWLAWLSGWVLACEPKGRLWFWLPV